MQPNCSDMAASKLAHASAKSRRNEVLSSRLAKNEPVTLTGSFCQSCLDPYHTLSMPTDPLSNPHGSLLIPPNAHQLRFGLQNSANTFQSKHRSQSEHCWTSTRNSSPTQSFPSQSSAFCQRSRLPNQPTLNRSFTSACFNLRVLRSHQSRTLGMC